MALYLSIDLSQALKTTSFWKWFSTIKGSSLNMFWTCEFYPKCPLRDCKTILFFSWWNKRNKQRAWNKTENRQTVLQTISQKVYSFFIFTKNWKECLLRREIKCYLLLYRCWDFITPRQFDHWVRGFLLIEIKRRKTKFD